MEYECRYPGTWVKESNSVFNAKLLLWPTTINLLKDCSKQRGIKLEGGLQP